MELEINTGLTKRENQIAGLAFCGLAKKEMADKLNIAYGTVNIHIDNAYKKTGTSKLNELGAWWINRVLALNINFEDLKKTIIALSICGLCAMQFSFNNNYELRRTRSTRNVRRRTEVLYEYII